VLAVVTVFAAWLVTGWWHHLVLSVCGGRGVAGQVLNVVAWAALPFALRSSVRVLAISNSQQLIGHPGLSGLYPALSVATLVPVVALKDE
jgi:hypothetical protein